MIVWLQLFLKILRHKSLHNRPPCLFCPSEEAGTTGYHQSRDSRQTAHPLMAPSPAPGSHRC
uniref:Uncharacterized protein n=1 Tax=Arundo donax TaxID=35708 RepID=A0A0A8ZA64_ARUDO